MQLICETLFSPRMSVTITFLTYRSYTPHSQSIAVVTTAPVYLFIARQSRNASKFNRLTTVISPPFLNRFHRLRGVGRCVNKKASIPWQDSAQRAANFRLLANQWAEHRLLTQWRHGCRAMTRNVCNACASNGGRSLCVQISRERSYPLSIYW